MGKIISDLNPTISPSRTHELAAMKDNTTVKLSVAQIIGLIIKADFISKFGAADVTFAPAGTIAAANVQAALQELDNETQAALSALGLARVGVVKTQVFNASGTYTPDSKLLYAVIECIGAGGGAGGAANNTQTGAWNASGGGGGGAYSRKTVTKATIGASQAVTVGAAGANGAAGNNNGNNGGASSVGTLCVANGGGGGFGAADGGAGGSGPGASTTGAVGDITLQGGNASNGRNGSVSAFFNAGGFGGASPVFGTQTPSGPPGTPGSAGRTPGSGGSGASSYNSAGANAGGAGFAGIVIITEYCYA
ncbi:MULTISPECIES: glycine-rich domain-containing protein [unclassified Rhizobium]|uniref:glycine-rich domain-containing protein n=1 Tax=unclassified Rhizobium TaxID=2613769 RepID=UPI00146D5D6C|nr:MULTISPECIES: hypothetical protein [unclassified Rhizobium]MBD9445749.1 hypothetical protein [Rhizobium sp. RHZ01]NMN73849.1 hypothetical protein [Rhizobium sp. 57MFTsu3.2]